MDADYLKHLFSVVESRRGADPDTSYIARLFAKGRPHLARKVGEEAVETAIAAISADKSDTIAESADLLFHLLVLWADAGIRVEEVLEELQRREGTSGLDEKRARKTKKSGDV